MKFKTHLKRIIYVLIYVTGRTFTYIHKKYFTIKPIYFSPRLKSKNNIIEQL